MKLQEIQQMSSVRKPVRTYVFTVYVDEVEVLTDVEMRWRDDPRGALGKFQAMIRRKFPLGEVDISFDWR